MIDHYTTHFPAHFLLGRPPPLDRGVHVHDMSYAHHVHRPRVPPTGASCMPPLSSLPRKLAVSFLHYDEIQLFDLETVLPDAEVEPALTLVPSGAGTGPVGRLNPGGVRRAFGTGGVAGGLGAMGMSGGGRGLGHSSFQFVARVSRPSQVACLVAGGRGGTFRAWRLGGSLPSGRVTPYIQVGGGCSRVTPVARAAHVSGPGGRGRG